MRKKQNQIKITDPISVIPKLNKFVVFGLIMMIGINAILMTMLIKFTLLRPTDSYIYRMYDDPTQNEAFVLNKNDNKITGQDVEMFVNYIVGIYDFQSRDVIRINNFRAMYELAGPLLKKKMDKQKTKILSKQTDVKFVHNEFIETKFEPYKKDPKILLARTKIKSVKINTKNVADTIEREIVLALKKVNKKFYWDSKNIGGKYYGLTLVDVSDDLLAI